MAKFTVYRDQAVWEREFFEIEVPDSIPESEREEWINEQLEANSVESFATEIISSVEGMDTEVTIYPA